MSYGSQTVFPGASIIARLGGRLALTIDASLLDKFISERQAKGVADGTISRELGLLGHMFNLAVEEKKLRADHLPKIPKFKEAKPRRGFLECEDFPRLHRELPEHLRTILTLAFYTWMRSGEVLTLRSENVDLIEGVLLLEVTKNGEARNVRLNDELLEMLKNERLRHPGSEWVFSRDGKTRIDSFRKTWKAACVRAGLGRFVCRGCGGELDAKSFCVSCKKRCEKPRYVGRIFHDLRRTGVRNLVRSGVSESVAMTISGHKTRNVFDRSNIGSDRDQKEASVKAFAYVRDRISQTLGKVEAPESGESAEPKTIM